MKEFQRIVLEGIIVLVAGAGVALLANAVSPGGLSLTRNYFPTRSHADADSTTRPADRNSTFLTSKGPATQVPGDPGAQSSTDEHEDGPPEQGENPIDPTGTDSSGDTANGGFNDQEQATVAHIEAEGLQAITHKDVVGLYNNPAHQFGEILFIDARNEKQFQEGHIPGAAHMDHYYIDNYIDDVFPLCQTALDIVVYCGGGDCEDSLFAAIELRNRGIDPSKIHVYIGGMKQWKADNQPVEVGDRHSGIIK